MKPHHVTILVRDKQFAPIVKDYVRGIDKRTRNTHPLRKIIQFFQVDITDLLVDYRKEEDFYVNHVDPRKIIYDIISMREDISFEMTIQYNDGLFEEYVVAFGKVTSFFSPSDTRK